jgi:hypothetical protein
MDRDRLAALVRSGQSTEEDRTALTAAINAVASAQADLQTALNGVFSAATTDLSSQQRAALSTLLANRSRHLPVQYLTVTRQEADWLTLSDALANQRVTTRTQEQPDPALAAALASVNASGPVSNATANLEANLATVASAWNAATQ